MNLRTRRARIVIASTSAVVIGVLTTWLLWPTDGEPPPREREYRDFTACLLTDDKGLQSDVAKSVWAGMQSASVANRVRVQFLAVTGVQTVENAVPYFNGLAMQPCQVILAAGEAPVAALLRGKASFPELRYVVVGDVSDSPGANLTTIAASPADQISTAVASVIAGAAGQPAQ